MQRLQIIAAALLILGLAAPAAAQGRVVGTVKDAGGRPIKGATVRALNPSSTSHEWTSTTDDKGRFVILGLRLGAGWRFIADAPGYVPGEGSAQVRSGGAPLAFVLRRDPGPIPGALPDDIQAQLSAARALREEGHYDQALGAYQAIQAKSPKLTAVNFVLAGIYRQKAAQEENAVARQTWLDKAIAADLAASVIPTEPK